MKKFLCLILAFVFCMCIGFLVGCDTPQDSNDVALECDIVGNVAVTESGLNFSAVKVTVKASEILENEKEYTVAVFIGSVELSVFDTFTYAKADMEFIGKSVNIPTLPVGEHTLSMYFALKTSAGCVRIKTVMPTVDSFAAFDKKIDAADGYYIMAFSKEGGALKIAVVYTAKPSVDDTDKNDGIIELPPLSIN